MVAEIKTASVLAFERKLDPSDALFYSGDWNSRKGTLSWLPVTVQEKSVRGTISNRLKAKDQDPAKLVAQMEHPNLQTVDVASLPADADTLKVVFTLRILPGAAQPSACNDMDYQEKLLQIIQSYVSTHGFGVLAKRYAANLANGRFLWRNRVGAESVEIHITHLQGGQPTSSWVFEGLDFSLHDFSIDSSYLDALAGVIESGLAGTQHVLLHIAAFVRIGIGQEVFPSQELVLDRGRGDKSKTLYTVNKVAGIHSQKIGNALRTIDTWYEGSGEIRPIAIEPYGSVTIQGKAYRQPKKKMDFYTLLDAWVLKDKVPEIEQQHYVLAMLIRGGVFSDAG